MLYLGIDQHARQITISLRNENGDVLLARQVSTRPRQMLILQSLGLPVPTYAHISLILGPDASPLSKRHGSRSIQALRETGYLPMAITNYLARLGHYYPNENFMTLVELAAQFKSARERAA